MKKKKHSSMQDIYYHTMASYLRNVRTWNTKIRDPESEEEKKKW